MEWIDEAFRQREAQRAREQAISDNEAEIFDALWEELKRHVDAARSKFPELFTNGQPHSRVVLLPVAPIPPLTESLPRKVIVSLHRDSHTISGVVIEPGGFGQPSRVTFQIDTRRDGTVTLKMGDVEIPYKAAAMYILRPFLFPELPPLPPYTRTSSVI